MTNSKRTIFQKPQIIIYREYAMRNHNYYQLILITLIIFISDNSLLKTLLSGISFLQIQQREFLTISLSLSFSRYSCQRGTGTSRLVLYGRLSCISSENLTDWTDHGVIVSQDKVPWVNTKAYAMWAPIASRITGSTIFTSLLIQKHNTG